jgi:hypothetical protein
VTSRDDAEVPKELRIAAAYAWRLIILSAAVAGFVYLLGKLSAVVIPLAIALLLSALLSPPVPVPARQGELPAVAGGRPGAGDGPGRGAGHADAGGHADRRQVRRAVEERAGRCRPRRELAADGPLHLSNEQLKNAVDTAQNWLNEHQGQFVSSAQSTATATVEALASFVLILFVTFFMMRDGNRIWRFLVRIFPKPAEEPSTRRASRLGDARRVRPATVLVAFIDAVGIGIGLYFLKVTLWFPLAGARVPVRVRADRRATLSGIIAVLVTLVERTPLAALVALAIVIGASSWRATSCSR